MYQNELGDGDGNIMFFSLKWIFPAVAGFIWKVFADLKTCHVRIHFHQIFKKLKQSDPITLRVGPNEVSTASMTRLVRNHRKWVAKILVLLLDLAGYKDTVTWDGLSMSHCSSVAYQSLNYVKWCFTSSAKRWRAGRYTMLQAASSKNSMTTTTLAPCPAFNTSSIDFAKLPWQNTACKTSSNFVTGLAARTWKLETNIRSSCAVAFPNENLHPFFVSLWWVSRFKKKLIWNRGNFKMHFRFWLQADFRLCLQLDSANIMFSFGELARFLVPFDPILSSPDFASCRLGGSVNWSTPACTFRDRCSSP